MAAVNDESEWERAEITGPCPECGVQVFLELEGAMAGADVRFPCRYCGIELEVRGERHEGNAIVFDCNAGYGQVRKARRIGEEA